MAPHPPTDTLAIQQCLAGNAHAFRSLVNHYQNPLLAFIRGRLTHHTTSPEEIAQESFVRAFTYLKRLQNPASFFPWLIGIADRVIKESSRSSARYHAALSRFATQQSNTTDSARQHDNDLELDRAVVALPETYREIVLLRYYADADGLSCSQIAERLDLPLGTVTKRLSRAYALLRDSLTPITSTERTCHEMH